jgi:hypothetical protein
MKKRKGVMIKIHLTNRWLYTLIAIGILALVGVGVYAYGTSSPLAFGHSSGEIDFSSGITTTNITTNKICLSGSCQTSWPSASKTFAIYNVTSSYCGSGLSVSSGCKTALCKTVQGNCAYYIPGTSFCQIYSYTYTYYTCAGACSSSSSVTCSNTLLGYLIS